MKRLTRHKKKGKLFENRLLERISRTPIWLPLVIFYKASIVLSVYGWLIAGQSLFAVAVMGLFGLLLFTLVEYLIHRYLFHISADTESRRQLQHSIHGIHHDHPLDQDRLAMPPVISVVLATGFYFLFRWVFGLAGYGVTAGFLGGYATYLLVHFVVHSYRMPRNPLRILWKHHNHHHFVDQKSAFGVSSPLWDWVFGTLPGDRRQGSLKGH